MAVVDAETAVRVVVEQYVDASRNGDVALLKCVFHPKAVMSGYLQGQLLIGGPEPFFDAVANNPSPGQNGEPYTAEIVRIDVTGKAAAAILVEKGFLGMDFTNYFHLLEESGEWRIIAKTFYQG